MLTSPLKTFVDIRYLKPIQAGESALPNQGEEGRLEWGFAGTSSSVSISKGDGKEEEGITHSTWHHYLDSRHPVADPSIPVDEGDMYSLLPTLTLEVGHAFHPHLGRVAGHEELWRDVDATSTNARGTKECVALRCQDDEGGVRGVVVRVGGFCQGIVMQGAETTTERWEWKEEVGGWKRVARTGGRFLPCLVVVGEEGVQVGGRVRNGGVEWVVEEVWEWE